MLHRKTDPASYPSSELQNTKNEDLTLFKLTLFKLFKRTTPDRGQNTKDEDATPDRGWYSDVRMQDQTPEIRLNWWNIPTACPK